MPRVLSDAMVSSSPDTHLTLAITPVHAAGCTRTGLDLQQAEAGAVGVEVRIDQAGDDRTAAAVNDPVARPGALRDLGDRTRGDPDASFPQRGDFLFDAAWCSFWAPFHLGIAAADPLSALLWAPSVRAEPGALHDAAARHHCYELHIGFTHLGWNIWTGNQADLAATARRLAEVLERGPLPLTSVSRGAFSG